MHIKNVRQLEKDAEKEARAHGKEQHKLYKKEKHEQNETELRETMEQFACFSDERARDYNEASRKRVQKLTAEKAAARSADRALQRLSDDEESPEIEDDSAEETASRQTNNAPHHRSNKCSKHRRIVMDSDSSPSSSQNLSPAPRSSTSPEPSCTSNDAPIFKRYKRECEESRAAWYDLRRDQITPRLYESILGHPPQAFEIHTDDLPDYKAPDAPYFRVRHEEPYPVDSNRQATLSALRDTLRRRTPDGTPWQDADLTPRKRTLLDDLEDDYYTDPNEYRFTDGAWAVHGHKPWRVRQLEPDAFPGENADFLNVRGEGLVAWARQKKKLENFARDQRKVVLAGQEDKGMGWAAGLPQYQKAPEGDGSE